MDSNLLGYRFVGIIRQILTDRVGEVQLSSLCQLRNSDPGKHLVHGSQVELRVDAIRRVEADACKPVSLGEDRLPFARQQHGAGKLPFGNQPLAKGFEISDNLFIR